MTPLTALLAIASYFMLMLGLTWFARRGGVGVDTLFGGGRHTPWPLVALATVGAGISGVTFISVPGMVLTKGYSYLQMVMGFIVGYALIAWVLVPVFYRHGLVSIYGYLKHRFGRSSYSAGAWFFFISKLSGASVRFFVVCLVLQGLVFAPLRLPFELCVAVSVALIWLYTARGGVKAVIWTDLLKTLCLILSAGLSIWFIARNLGLGAGALAEAVRIHPTAQVFNFADPASTQYFWKQFVAGVFMAVATNGLDQDMMQRNLECRTSTASRNNLLMSAVMQFFIIAMFLVLGTVLSIYVERIPGMELPAKSDDLFALVATHPTIPAAVGLMFVVGLVSASYSAAGSAMNAITNSFTIDILGRDPQSPAARRCRQAVHLGVSLLMALAIVAFYRLANQDAISAVYTLASYTYGPILGLFAFGLISTRPVNDRLSPAACICAPLLAWASTTLLYRLTGYETGFELLIVNALFTMAGLWIASISAVRRQPRLTR